MCGFDNILINVSPLEGGLLVDKEGGIGIFVVATVEFFGVAVAIHVVIIVDDKSILEFNNYCQKSYAKNVKLPSRLLGYNNMD